MGSLSIWHWLIVGAVLLLVFGGGGKISNIMGDFAKGIKAFKKGLSEEEQASSEPPSKIEATAANQQAREKDRATTV